jgi:RNA-splicing ligase RtcB
MWSAGIVGASTGLPDLHSGYAFAIGHVAAFDLDSNEGVVSPGGVGYDIACGEQRCISSISFSLPQPSHASLLGALTLPSGLNLSGCGEGLWAGRLDTQQGLHIVVDPRGCTACGGKLLFVLAAGVRLLRTDLHVSDLSAKRREKLADTLFDLIPVGVGEGAAQK